MAKNLYGAYKAGGAANIKYRENLYEAEQYGQEIAGSRQMLEIGKQQRNVMIGTISEGISLASNIFGGFQAKKERAAEIEGLGKSEYESGLKKGDVSKWGELSSEERAGYTPQQTYGETKLWDLLRGKAYIDKAGGETAWGEAGERLSVLLGGERKYDWQGKEWTGSELSAKSQLDRASERGLPTEEEKKEGYQFSESGTGSESWFKEKITKFKEKNWDVRDMWSPGTSLHKYNPQLLTMAEEAGWTGKSWQ